MSSQENVMGIWLSEAQARHVDLLQHVCCNIFHATNQVDRPRQSCSGAKMKVLWSEVLKRWDCVES